MSPLFSPKAHARARVIRRFVKKLGLVYFGTVDQHRDEHQVIRGLTLSTSHQDNHYAVGSYNDYDVSLVDRTDSVKQAGSVTRHSWLILQIDLKASRQLPHVFLKPNNHSLESYQQLFTAFASLQPINSVLAGQHTSEFHDRYQLYAVPTHTQEVERYFSDQITQQIATRFWPYAIELYDNKLFIYDTEVSLNETRLQMVLESGLWLAEMLDDSVED